MGDMATTTAMLIPMPTTDTTARGPLMLRLLPLLRLMLMPTMAPMATVWLITDTAMVLPTTVMATMDTTARGLLMPLPLLMLTMALMAMVWLTTDTAMVLPTTAMPTMDTTDIPTPMDTTDIINLFIFVKN